MCGRQWKFVVLFVGWLLGGPVFLGTVLYSVFIGPLAGMTLRQMQAAADYILKKLSKKNMPLSRDTCIFSKSKRGVTDENIDKRQIRSDHHDRIGKKIRGWPRLVKIHRSSEQFV